MNELVAVVLAYLLGSIPFAYLAGRARGIDLRKVGSGNLGAANVFRNLGRGWGIAVMAADIGKGILAQSVLPLEPDERIEAIIDTRDYETARFLVMVTRNGTAKKTLFREYESRNQTLVAIKLSEGDEVVSVRTTGGNSDVMIFTKDGQGIRFPETDLRPMGRATQGVRGIRLRPGDEVVAAISSALGDEVLLITSGGYGKRTALEHFNPQGRGGIGVKAIKPPARVASAARERGRARGSPGDSATWWMIASSVPQSRPRAEPPAPASNTRAGAADRRTSRENSRARRVLPNPSSPSTTTTAEPPAAARAQASWSRERIRSRPTSSGSWSLDVA